MDEMVAARTPLGTTQPVEELARDTALQQAFGVLGVGVGIAVEDGRLIDANDALLELLGLDRAAVLGSSLTELLDGLGAGDLSLRRSGGSTEHSFTRGDGRRTWARVTVTDVRGRDERVLLAVHAVEDVTDQKALEAGLRERALLDPVTGLPNRYLLEDRLEHALAQRRRGGHELAVLFVDLDGFKRVNDTAGHRVGDAVLREAGRRITASARVADTVARWAGDEFVVLCEGVAERRDAERIAERITAACAEPFGAGGHVFTLGASVGLSMTGPPPSADADTLLDLADQAMYADKSARRRTGDQDTP